MPVDRFSPRTLDAAVAQSLSQNPSVTAAMYDVDVAQLQVRIAEAGLYPTLTLQEAPSAAIHRERCLGETVQQYGAARMTVRSSQGGSEYSAIRQNKEERRPASGLSLDQVRDQVRATSCSIGASFEATKAQTEAAERQTSTPKAPQWRPNEAKAGQRTPWTC